MTIYTDGLIVDRQRNLLDDVVSGQGDTAEAAFDQALFENPTMALRRSSELDQAEKGRVIQNEQQGWGYVAPEVREAPTTPLLSAEQARERVKESGLELTIGDEGIREGALDILMTRKKAETQRKFVLDNAPVSTVPVQLLAGFAASAIDPINIASAFVPIVGEARYASMLARATTRAARFGVRARVGALEGAVGAALVEPLVLHASAQDQSDYDMTDSLLNIAFGTVLGGGLHAAGGYVSDTRRTAGGMFSGSLSASTAGAVDNAPGATVEQRALRDMAILRGDDDPMTALNESLRRAIEADRPKIAEAARIQATEELTPTIRAELEEIANGKLPNIADIRTEISAITKRANGLDATFKERAKQFQSQQMTRKEAERAARESVALERQELTERQAEMEQSLEGNRQAEQARAELGRLERGELPEQFKERVGGRASEIESGFGLNNTARSVAENAPWQVRESALRSAVSQAVTGRPIDVQAIFDLADPIKRDAALARLKEPVKTVADPEGEVASYAADQTSDALDPTDLEGAEKMLADEEALTYEMAEQAGVDVEPYLKEANTVSQDADAYAAAYRAAALCQLRT
ncbi:hypothetical protein [Pseudomonas segetis]|uniref:Uncharacterized protein n=1 Tax=Pseudomonas segetis TaxID=298908 RepID=A0A239C692_9PSED|nr:hypothetical protein [Pseudomonas segetis]SNS15736.1 hypothetical protein SAMN05216255_1535 [Pseudomonas segetis]